MSNKPTIPTVNNATLTIQRNGTTVDTFTANASVDKTININTADDTKIPLAGSNQISGDLVPATDNSIDVGSSSKNIKMLYTKGITIDAKTIDTDANGNMTFNGNIVDTIEEQGEGYIRYSNGIQICWGSISIQSSCSAPWGSLFETKPMVGSYAKSFVENPAVSVSGINMGSYSAIIESSGGSNTNTPRIWLCRTSSSSDEVTCTACYIAIGRWK